MISAKRLAEWSALEQAATKGPWKLWNGYGPVGTTPYHAAMRIGPDQMEEGNPWAGILGAVDYPPDGDLYGTAADLEFVAVAREMVPALIVELQDLRGEQAARNRRGKVLMQKLYQTIDKFEYPPSDELWVITANLMGQLGDLFHELQEDEEEGDPDD